MSDNYLDFLPRNKFYPTKALKKYSTPRLVAMERKMTMVLTKLKLTGHKFPDKWLEDHTAVVKELKRRNVNYEGLHYEQ